MKSLWSLVSIVVVTFTLAFFMSGLASAQTYTSLYSFTGNDGAESPVDNGSLALDANGNIYGTTKGEHTGTVFELTTAGQEMPIYYFKGHAGGDGAFPYSGLSWDNNGNLYGTTSGGGVYRDNTYGTVFKLQLVNGTWTEAVVYNFENGGRPKWGMTFDAQQGNLYGFTSDGGGNQKGSAYKIDSTGSYTLFTTFKAGGGIEPVGVPALDSAGNLYGATAEGGRGCDCGVIFKLNPAGQETVLYKFRGQADGGYPNSSLILDTKARALYGTASAGGDLSCGAPYGCGVLFKVGAAGETVVHSFTGGADGGYPSSIIRDANGNIYGAARAGGDLTCDPAGCGLLFKLDTANNFTVLYAFSAADFPAGQPGCCGGLVLDGQGNLYGTTAGGGDPTCECGTVFKLSLE
jgi:uncharacterized repeat protein (TIGR03803 family)